MPGKYLAASHSTPLNAQLVSSPPYRKQIEEKVLEMRQKREEWRKKSEHRD